MIVFVIRRALQSVLLVLILSFLVFVAVYAIGDPVSTLVPPDATEEERQALVVQFGLDRPLHVQYVRFLSNAAHGDLGRSFKFNEPALRLIVERVPATLELAFIALALTILLGIPLGLFAGFRPEAFASKAILAVSALGFSVPIFWLALMLVMVFSVELGWLPSSGRGETVRVLGVPVSFLTLDGLRHLVLPAVGLAAFKLSLVIRLTRAATQEIVLSEYVRFARAKGLTRRRIVLVHVLKNILVTLVTVLGLEFGRTIAFAVVTESIYAWPGMGKLIIESINVLDRPVIVAYLMVVVVMFLTINLAVDILYSALDPRVRLGEKR